MIESKTIMIKAIFVLVNCLSLFGCQKESNEYYLYRGLEGYDKFRYINEEFVKSYGVQKIAFFQEAGQLQYVLKLADNVTLKTVENYSLGVRVYADQKYLSEDQKFLMWDTKPRIQEIGGYKYIINGFKKPIKEIDSLSFFLYDRERYQRVLGNVISIKKIKL